MNSLLVDYRDPLFGVVAIVLIVFIVSFLGYTYNLYVAKKSRKEYQEFLRRFELGELKEEDYASLYTTYNLPFDSILLLASSFLQKGEYNKAVIIYQSLLLHIKDPIKKEELLELLGKTYFKGGFLQRSKEIYMKILKFSPRNKEALFYLLYICEKLKDYTKAKDILESLDEVDQNTKNDKTYIQTLTIKENFLMNSEEKTLALYEIYREHPFIERIFLQFLLQYNRNFFWKQCETFELSKVIDLLWYLQKDEIDIDVATRIPYLCELYCAKGYLEQTVSSNTFELQVLIALRSSPIETELDLNFYFVCNKCKKSIPMFDNR